MESVKGTGSGPTLSRTWSVLRDKKDAIFCNFILLLFFFFFTRTPFLPVKFQIAIFGTVLVQ